MIQKPQNTELHELPLLGAHMAVAAYCAQRIPAYQGNPLIEALPPSKGDLELVEAMAHLPKFEPSERLWETHERMHQLLSLSNIMVPLESHIQLARVLDSMMRQGYVGRSPLSKAQVATYHDIHRLEAGKQPFRQTVGTITPQLSTSLIGLSGMGKTTAARRFLAQTPQVIYHPKLGIYQITYLHVETPSDGKSVKALAIGILQQIDELLPDCNYYNLYVGSGRASGDALMRSAARVLNMHMVGLLVCDEVQNLCNAKKGEQIVMTELVSACNLLKVPILFIGTNKAERILGLDFRQARRSLGFLGHWNALPRTNLQPDDEGRTIAVPGEWVEFMEVLWRYQWIRVPVPLVKDMLDVFYHCTQGVIDLAIKLFVASQARAMADGSETLSAQLIVDIYNNELKLIHPMVDALRNGDRQALLRFEDITPIGLSSLVDDMASRYRSPRLAAASVRPGTPDFEPRLAAVGIALGLPEADAARLAGQINEDGCAKNMFDATTQLLSGVAVPRQVKPRKSKKADASPALLPDYPERPMDYRRASFVAQQENTTVAEQLLALGLARKPEDLVCLV